MKKSAFSFLVVLFFSLAAFAEYNIGSIPDSAQIRRSIESAWLLPSVSVLRGYAEEFRENEAGTAFQIRMEESDSEFSVVVAPRSELDIDLINGESHHLVRASVYPKGAPGSWILHRDKKTGNPLRIELHFSQDADVFVQFRQEGSKTFADMLVYGSYAARSVPMGIPFRRLYSASFQEIRNWTARTLPWNKVSVIPGQYRDSLVMVSVIKDNLSSFVFTDSAAYDEAGELKSIVTGGSYEFASGDGNRALFQSGKAHCLSGAGFLKWIIDGIVEPITGRGTSIVELLSPTVQFDPVGKLGVLSQEWNMTFALDWCRNLAAQAYSVRSRRTVDFKSAGLDVTYSYFSSDVKDGVIVNSSGYIKDTGYAAERIKPLLYVLGVTEPSWFYLAAIRQGSSIKPDELVFNNCAVLFPYFSENGRFGCFVFEQGAEISLEAFIEKYKGSYIHLDRVKATETFFPYEKK